MAKVEMELSELDALRDSLKEAKAEKEKLSKELDNLKLTHSAELDNLKKGALVIEKTPIVEIKSNTPIDVHYLALDILKIINDTIITGIPVNAVGLENYLASKINRNQPMEYAFRPMETTNVIERIIGFNEVEKEVKEYYIDQNENLIAKSKEIIANENKLRNSLIQEFKEKEITLFKETQDEIETIKAECLKEIEQLNLKHKEVVKQYTKEKTINETLEALGYKIEKGIFGNKLIKINQ